MTNLRTDEMAFFHSLTKIGNDENKAIYSSPNSDTVFMKRVVCFYIPEPLLLHLLCS